MNQRLYAAAQLQFHPDTPVSGLAPPAEFQRLVRAATAADWVVYSKRPFAGPEQVLAYFSRYTHRVGISNGRNLAFDPAAATVTFRYRDYADHSCAKTMALSSAEFVRRLRLHILPARFVKIRHYGLLANRGRQTRIAAARRLLGQRDPPAEIKTNAIAREAPAPTWACPHCGKRELVLVRVVHPPRGGRPGAALDSSGAWPVERAGRGSFRRVTVTLPVCGRGPAQRPIAKGGFCCKTLLIFRPRLPDGSLRNDAAHPQFARAEHLPLHCFPRT
jgi:hypothetical protein